MSEEENRPRMCADDHRTNGDTGNARAGTRANLRRRIVCRASGGEFSRNARSNVATLEPSADQTDFDVIIVGAGLSGIGVAYRVQRDCPRRSFAIPDATLPLSSGYMERAKDIPRSRARSGRGNSNRTTPGICWRCASD
jgi:hypothetical protein